MKRILRISAFSLMILCLVVLSASEDIGHPKDFLEARSKRQRALCPLGWIQDRGSCYVIYVDQKTWHNAERHCRRLGGYLVRIQDEREDRFLSIHIALPEPLVWIGLRRSEERNSFMWSDGSNSSYSNWGFREPRADASGRDCAHMYSGNVISEWQTEFCSTRQPYICEREGKFKQIPTTASTIKVVTKEDTKFTEKVATPSIVLSTTSSMKKMTTLPITEKPKTKPTRIPIPDTTAVNTNVITKAAIQLTTDSVGAGEGISTTSIPVVSTPSKGCGTTNQLCGQNAECMQTSSGENCECKFGFEGDGVICADINECGNGRNDCHSRARCSNIPGSYTCQCNQGFTGDGKLCQDKDECTDGTSTCHHNASCMNTFGSYLCKCNLGFIGDGLSCQGTDNQVDRYYLDTTKNVLRTCACIA